MQKIVRKVGRSLLMVFWFRGIITTANLPN
jgi:hypothetical protein